MNLAHQQYETAPSAWPQRLLWGGVAALLILLLASIGALRLIHSKYAAQLDEIRARGEPLSFAELDRFVPRLAADRDVTQLILQAGNDLNARSKNSVVHNLAIVGQGAPPPPPGTAWPQLAAAEQYLADNAASLALLHQLTSYGGRARLAPLDSAQAVSKALERVQPVRACARALQLEMNVRAHHDDAHGTAESIEAGIWLSETLADEPWLVSQLVRCALFGIAGHELKRSLPALPFSDEDLQELQRTLTAVDFQSSLRLALVGERVGGLEQFQLLLGGKDWRSAVIRLAHGEDQRQFLKIMSEYLSLAEKPWPQLMAESDALAHRIGANATRAHSLSDASVQSFTAMIDGFARVELTRRLLIVAVALERHRLRHGQPAADLASLVPDFLAEVPTDPIDGAPFHYRADGVGYLLFSPTQKFPIPAGERPDAETGANPMFVVRRPAQAETATGAGAKAENDTGESSFP